MAYTFLKARGVEIGDSRLEPDLVETAGALFEESRARGVPLLLPIDHRVKRADAAAGGGVETTPGEGIPRGARALDIGPATVRSFASALRDAKTVLWNGPVGLFEEPPFDEGTRAVAEAILASGAHSIVGGGDTASAVRRFGLETRFTHVSTGGGAALEYLSGLELPGLEALSEAGS
jgi:3-phosphoglycerate kinase